MSVHHKRKLRTFWHSGMLLILMFLDGLKCQENQMPPHNYQIQLVPNDDSSDPVNLTSGTYFHHVNRSEKFICAGQQLVKINWKLGGEKPTGLSSSGEVDVDPGQQVDLPVKLECFAHGSTGTSYAFIYLSAESQMAEALTGLRLIKMTNRTDDRLIQLQCELDGHITKVTWLKNGQPILEDNYHVISSTDSLDIDLSGPDQTGTYGCLVETGSGGAYQEVGIMSRFHAPVIKHGLPNVIVGNATQNATLKCVVESYPVASLVWLRNDVVVDCNSTACFQSVIVRDPRLEVHQLRLENLVPEQAGSYECLAENSLGKDSSRTDLKVASDDPDILAIHVDVLQEEGQSVLDLPEETLVLKGKQLRLTCESSGWPPVRVDWSLTSQGLEGQSGTSIILRADQTGEVTCSASNDFDQSTSKSLNLTVLEPTRLLMEENEDNEVIEADLDSALELTCNVLVDPILESGLKFVWSKNGQVLQHQTSSILNIPDLSEGDGGIYQCVASTFLDSVIQHWTVEVFKAPRIIPGFPSRIAALEGQHLSLPCLATGLPEPETRWEKMIDGIVDEYHIEYLDLVDLHTAVNLTIDKVNKDNEGFYKCVSVNKHGKAELGLLIVRSMPTQLPLSFVNGSLLEKDAGSSVILRCNASIDLVLEPFGVTLQWYKDGKLLGSNQASLEIPYLIGHEHSGTYSCHIKTQVDFLIMTQVLQVVTQSPKIEMLSESLKVMEGHNVTLECRIKAGIPYPAIKWKKGQDIVANNSSRLILTSVSLVDASAYTCLAVNEYGSDSVQTHLDVLSPTVIYPGPQDLVIQTFTSVSLQCHPVVDRQQSSDRVSVEWFFNDGEDPISHSLMANHSLVLANVTKQNEGQYTCKVTTAYDVVKATGHLTVLAEAPSFLSTEKDVRTLENSTAVIACQANGMPIPRMNWFKNNLVLDLSDQRISQHLLGDLTIINVQLGDQAIYKCVASNIYGEVSTSTNLEVIRRSVPRDTHGLAREVVKNVRDNVTLNCGISYDPRIHKETDVQWYRMTENGGQQLPINYNLYISTSKARKKYLKMSDHTLAIFELSVEDRGKYVCLVQTPFESLPYTVQLFVHGEPPKILTHFKKVTLYEGDRMVLPCLVRGVPRPSLDWYFNERPMDADLVVDEPTGSHEFIERRVVVERVTKMHEGVYQCEAENTYGSGIAKFAKVAVVRRTHVQIAKEEISVHAGQKLRIPCHVDSDPLNRITSIRWQKDNAPMEVGAHDHIDFGMDGSITIADVQKRHGGQYRCTVTTVLDHANATIPVRVIVNAPVITSHSGDRVIFGGNSLTLFCKSNGIPVPTISWMFNKTDTGIRDNRELKITKAIQSDSGQYVCISKNQYGETRQFMTVKVIQVASLETEYLIQMGRGISVPCVDDPQSIPGITLYWKLSGKPITNHENQVVISNGSLSISSMTEKHVGIYSCTATLPNGQRRIVQTLVRLRPEIIKSLSRVISTNEGDDIRLECRLVPGVEAKRLWQYNGNYFDYGARKNKRSEGGLLVIQAARRSDSGNYSCIAIRGSEQDVLTYTVTVKKNNKGVSTRCDQQADQPMAIAGLYKADNSTATVAWQLPPDLNQSCFDHIALVWWTNSSETSTFSEMTFSLDDRQGDLTGLTSDHGYYVQVNLVAPLNVHVYGHTRSFTINQLPFRSPDVLASDQPVHARPVVLVLMVAGGILAALATVLTLLLYWRRKHRGLAGVRHHHHYVKATQSVKGSTGYGCYACRDWCYSSPKVSRDSAAFQKTDFNGFDTGMYESAIMPPVNGEYPSGLTGRVSSKNANNDFMANLAPQWPEPEEPSSSGAEADPFLRKHSTFVEGGGGHRLRGSNESISSSWSSLFNVPGSTHNVSAIRPNSVAVSNLSSSGSAADYKVAHIGHKYRRAATQQ